MFEMITNAFAAFGLFVFVCRVISLIYNWYVPNNYISAKENAQKYILITGCDTGFGNLLTKQLDKLGCQVIATCLTENGRGKILEECSSNVKPIIMDVTNKKSVKNAYGTVDTHIPKGAGLWGLVNNAGNVNAALTIETESIEDLQRIMDVNLWGAVRVTKAFLPLLKKSKGRVVNVTSVLSKTCVPMTAGYCMSKFGMRAFTWCSRLELSKWGISVHCIEPGFFKTNLTDTQTVTAKFQKNWNKLDVEVKAEYEEFEKGFYDSLNIMNKITSTDVTFVTNAMEHALLSKSPRITYVVGYDNLLFFNWFHTIPSFISDRFMSIAFMRFQPKSMKK